MLHGRQSPEFVCRNARAEAEKNAVGVAALKSVLRGVVVELVARLGRARGQAIVCIEYLECSDTEGALR